jgi:acyl carrier protein
MTDSLSHAISAHIEVAAYLAPGELDAGEPLFSAGIIDSMNMLELVVFVEKSCGIEVPPSEITLEHWDCVQSIVAYVNRKLARTRSG